MQQDADRALLDGALLPGQDRFAVAYCGNCGCMSAMAAASIARDVKWAVKDLDEWENDNRRTGIIIKNPGDPMPEWCSCGECC